MLPALPRALGEEGVLFEDSADSVLALWEREEHWALAYRRGRRIWLAVDGKRFGPWRELGRVRLARGGWWGFSAKSRRGWWAVIRGERYGPYERAWGLRVAEGAWGLRL